MPQDTELHKAAYQGDVEGVKDCLGRVDVNEKGAQGDGDTELLAIFPG